MSWETGRFPIQQIRAAGIFGGAIFVPLTNLSLPTDALPRNCFGERRPRRYSGLASLGGLALPLGFDLGDFVPKPLPPFEKGGRKLSFRLSAVLGESI